MAAVNNLNLNNLNKLAIVDVAKLHIEFFGHCIKLYLRFFADYEHLIQENIKSHKIARYILLNKQVNRSKHFFYNNKLLLKATQVKPLFTQLTLQPIFLLFQRNVLSFTKRTFDQRQTVMVNFRDHKPLGRHLSGRTGSSSLFTRKKSIKQTSSLKLLVTL